MTQRCLRVFLKIKPALTEALKEEGIEGEKQGVLP
jgi:hypothetical protein